MDNLKTLKKIKSKMLPPGIKFNNTVQILHKLERSISENSVDVFFSRHYVFTFSKFFSRINTN